MTQLPQMPAMTPMLIALIVVAVGATVLAGLTIASMFRRRTVLRRAGGESDVVVATSAPLLAEAKVSALPASLTRLVPRGSDTADIRTKLVQAGIESATAPQTFFLLRMVSLTAFPALAWLIVPHESTVLFFLALGLGVFAGFIVPLAMLDRMIRLRQDVIRRSVPDALDLLVVCVEAGIS
ncbi:MAG: hypothetical protein ABMA00_10770, partial [Gemmatimonas sp.]